MNEQDKQLVHDARALGVSFPVVRDLVLLIDRLDAENRKLNKQLAEVKEAGEVFGEFVKHFPREDDNYEIAFVVYAGSEARITLGNLRRLAQALDEVRG